PGVKLSCNGYYNVFHWREPIRVLIEGMKDGYQIALDAGQIALAVNCLVQTAAAPFVAGVELVALEQRMREIVGVVEQHKQGVYAIWLRLYWQCALNLMNDYEDPCVLKGEAYDEDRMMPVHRANDDTLTLAGVYVLKVMLSYRFGRYREAVAWYKEHV